MNMDHDKQLNPRTRYTIIPDFSVIVHQDNQTVILTGQEIARLHMDVSTQPSVEVPVPGLFINDPYYRDSTPGTKLGDES